MLFRSEIVNLIKGLSYNSNLSKMPFAGYSSFEECVSQNQDKDNPEAYCGAVQAQAEKSSKGETMPETNKNESSPEIKIETAIADKNMPEHDKKHEEMIDEKEKEAKKSEARLEAVEKKLGEFEAKFSSIETGISGISKSIESLAKMRDEIKKEAIDDVKKNFKVGNSIPRPIESPDVKKDDMPYPVKVALGIEKFTPEIALNKKQEIEHVKFEKVFGR